MTWKPRVKRNRYKPQKMSEIQKLLKQEDERLAREEKRKLAKHKDVFDAKRENQLNSNADLQASSEKLLRDYLAKCNAKFKGRDLLSTVMKADLGGRFSRKRRADNNLILAIGCALFHQICKQKNSSKALHLLAKSAGVAIKRISDPCRIIVDSLIDYGSTQEEKNANRQYAARDARALRYLVREGYDPHDVMRPADGENVTIWAEREAAYRSKQRSRVKPRKKAPTVALSATGLPDQLAVAHLNEGLFLALESMVEQGAVIVTPKNGGKALAVAVAPLKGVAVNEAAVNAVGVQKAIRKAVKKAVGKLIGKPAKPPAVNAALTTTPVPYRLLKLDASINTL